jgi:hypothetical protein
MMKRAGERNRPIEMNFRVSVFDDYRWKGSDLKDLSLQYMNICQDYYRKRVAKHRTGSDINFHANHPEHGEKTQVICALKGRSL